MGGVMVDSVSLTAPTSRNEVDTHPFPTRGSRTGHNLPQMLCLYVSSVYLEIMYLLPEGQVPPGSHSRLLLLGLVCKGGQCRGSC